MLKCHRCGESNMKNQEDKYACNSCGASYLLERAEKYADEVRKIFGEALAEQKEEQIANCRRNLWKAARAEHVSSTEVLHYARELKKLLPDDFQANFYEVANSGTLRQINSFINKINVEENGIYVADIADFIIRSLESSNVLPLKDLITRGLKGDKYTQYMTKVEDEAAKLKDGIYSPQVPRDVFVAYSSKDGKSVNEIVEFLEENKISCFVALRNLRHGRGSVENYLNNLKTAMHNCKCVVFLSSNHSRDLDCDALKIELPYIKDNEPQMGRIEYLLSEYGADTPYAAKRILENFFNGLEYCRTKEDLVDRLLDYITGDMNSVSPKQPVPEVEDVKYCTKCGSKNPKAMKFCGECGGNDFAETYEEALRKKLDREYAEKFKKQQHEVEEQLKKQREEAERKAREHKAAEKAERAKDYADEIRKIFARAEQTEAERRAKENYPTLENYDKSEFKIEGTILKKYKGNKSEVVIPDGVTEIGDFAFSCCSRFTSIAIPSSVTQIGIGAFIYCSGLTNIAVEKGNRNYYSKNNCIIETSSKTLVLGCKNSVIPADGSVTSIGVGAFCGCSNLANIKIPNGVISIDEQAFYGCSSLTSITIPKSITSIDFGAFAECTSLESITIPRDVTFIGDRAFFSCLSLKTIYCESSSQPKDWVVGWKEGCMAKVVWGYKG